MRPRNAGLAAVVEAGVRASSGWATVADRYAGWVGVGCPDAESAVRLLRVVVVEEMAARREEAVLYLPAGQTAAQAEAAGFIRAAKLWAAHRQFAGKVNAI